MQALSVYEHIGLHYISSGGRFTGIPGLTCLCSARQRLRSANLLND